MVLDKNTITKDPKRTRDGGIVMEEIHDEREIGITTCTTIWSREVVTIIELPLAKSAVRS